MHQKETTLMYDPLFPPNLAFDKPMYDPLFPSNLAFDKPTFFNLEDVVKLKIEANGRSELYPDSYFCAYLQYSGDGKPNCYLVTRYALNGTRVELPFDKRTFVPMDEARKLCIDAKGYSPFYPDSYFEFSLCENKSGYLITRNNLNDPSPLSKLTPTSS